MSDETHSTHQSAPPPTVLDSSQPVFSVGDVEELRGFVQSAPAAMMAVTDSFELVACSDRMKNLIGNGAADLDDECATFFDCIYDPNTYWESALTRCIEEQKAMRGEEALFRSCGGAERQVHWEMRPWTARRAGEQGAWLAFEEQTLQPSGADQQPYHIAAQHEALQSTIEEGVLLIDRSGVFQSCNVRAEHILGRPASEIIGSTIIDEKWRGIREDGTPLPNESFPFWEALHTGEPVNGEVMGIYPPEGPPRWLRVNVQPLMAEGKDHPYAALATFADITEQRLSEEALRTSKDLLSSVLRSSLDGIMVLTSVRDQNGRIVDFEWLLANPQAEELIDRSAEELVGEHLLDKLPGHETSGLFENYVDVVESGEPIEREVFYDWDGIQGWLRVAATKLNDGLAVTFRDITERKEAAQEMEKTNAELEERNRALREFAYIASHDLQEPLRKITAFADLMREDYEEAVDETGEYYLERMQDAAQRMSGLITDLLEYSRVTTQAKPFEEVDLNTIARNVRSDLEFRIRDVDGQVEIGDLPTIEADSTQIRQLLQNLISNGLKFHRSDVPPVVRVTADIEEREAPDDPDRTVPWCVLQVEDNGIGMKKKYLDRIFVPFKRLHGRSQFEGTGMGLAICHRIAERHEGTIEVDSEPDEGTTFTISIPAVRPDAAQDQEDGSTRDKMPL